MLDRSDGADEREDTIEQDVGTKQHHQRSDGDLWNDHGSHTEQDREYPSNDEGPPARSNSDQH